MCTPPKIGTLVPVPPLRNDELRSSTVLPYLDAYHYGTDDMEQDYYTEHDLSGLYHINDNTELEIFY